MSNLSLKRRRDIGRQKWQFIAVLVTVTLGVALFAAMFNAYLNLGSSLGGSYERLNMADMTVTGADDGFVETASAIEGVEDAIERRQADVPFEIDEYSFIGRAVGLPANDQPAINMLDIEEGAYLDGEDETQILIEEHAASDFEIEVGDDINILGREFTVAGIAVSPEYLWPAKDRQTVFTPPKTFAVAFVDESLLEQLSGPSVQDQVLITYEATSDRAAIDGRIESAAESANAADVQTLEEQPSNSIINEEISALQTMAVALPLLFLLAAGMAIYVVITRIVYSQRGVIGTLMATGFRKSTMSRHYRSYGIGVGLIGAVIGAVVGGLMARGLTAVYLQVFGIPDLVADFHLPTVIMALVFGAVAGFIAAVPPARIVASMPPAEAMRGDAPPTGGKRSIFETLLPPLRGVSVRWRMTLRGLGRNKRRSMALVLGVVLSAVLILAAAGMIDTMLLAFDRQFNEVAVEDTQVFFGAPVTDEAVSSVSSVTGVETAEPVVTLSSTIRFGDERYSTYTEGYERNTAVHGFPDGLSDTGIMLGLAMKDLLGVAVGERVDIEFSDLDTSITALVAGFVDEPLTTASYMNVDHLADQLNAANDEITAEILAQPSITSVKAVYQPGVAPDPVISDIRELPGVVAVVDSSELRSTLESFQAFFYVFVGIALVFGGAMAFALIFNIISVNVAERVGEFASMRANGLTHRKVASMITGETYLLTAFGLIPGLLAGYWAAVAFMGSFSSDQFPIVAEVRAWTFVLTAIALFIVAGLSLIPAVRAVKRINIGEIVRERAV